MGLRVHCDGSFVSESQLAACGITIVDAHGQVIDGKTERFYCSYPIQAEAFAILGAVVLAAQESCPTCIKSDCQRLIVALIQAPAIGLGNVLRPWPGLCLFFRGLLGSSCPSFLDDLILLRIGSLGMPDLISYHRIGLSLQI
ncbi:unnamed protein product [Linum trigynum]|uniref:RNase H type-1 domain-containing protein n=1 Tax=Linum trigynum TaxID=586398 RepID=A0AAV2FYA2_9ROSI